MILPILTIKNTVFFPNTVIPLLVGREKSLKLIEHLIKTGSQLGVVAQKDATNEDPTSEEIYKTGTLARIIKFSKNAEGHYNVIIEGIARFEINKILTEEPFFTAEVLPPPASNEAAQEQIPLLFQTLRETSYDICRSLPEIPATVKGFIDTVKDPGTLADIIASNLGDSVEEKQNILETHDVADRILKALELLGRKHEMLVLHDKINNSVKEEISRNQKEYYLRQQLKAINNELGEATEENDDLNVLKEKMKTIDLPDEVVSICLKEIKKNEKHAAKPS